NPLRSRRFCPLGGWYARSRTYTDSAFETCRFTLQIPVFILEQKSPRELIRPSGSCVASRPTDEIPNNLVACLVAFAPQFAPHLISVFVSPDSSTYDAGGTVIEHDRLGSKTHSRSSRTREQQRPLKIRNRRLPNIAKPQIVAVARRSPSSVELMPVVTCLDGHHLWATATGSQNQNSYEEKMSESSRREHSRQISALIT